MKNRYLFYLLLTCLLILASGSGYSVLSGMLADNQPPVVKIESPLNNATYTSGTRVPYSINVADAEDGNSRYEEINTKEVFLEIRFVPETQVNKVSTDVVKEADDPGFRILRSSNCANCHLFKGKLIGPSYEEIGEKYKMDEKTIDLLSNRILAGTSGVWGNVKMPSHPELNAGQAQQIVRWILEKAKDTNLDYKAGTSGSFLSNPPDGEGQKGDFILTAIYTDHGSDVNSQDRLTGVNRITIHIK